MWSVGYSAVLYTCLHPTLTPIQKTALFCMFSLFNFLSIFPGDQLTPFAPLCADAHVCEREWIVAATFFLRHFPLFTRSRKIVFQILKLVRPCQQWAGCNLRPILLLYWGDASPNSTGVCLYMAIFVGSEIALGQWAEMYAVRVAMLPLGIHFEYIDRTDGRTDRHRTVAIRY